VKLTKEGSNITVAVDANGTAGGAEGANWVDVGSLDNSASSADQLTILIDDTDHQLIRLRQITFLPHPHPDPPPEREGK